MARVVDVLRQVVPKASPGYLAAFDSGDSLLQQHQITTPDRLAHFLAQILHESGGLTLEHESMKLQRRSGSSRSLASAGTPRRSRQPRRSASPVTSGASLNVFMASAIRGRRRNSATRIQATASNTAAAASCRPPAVQLPPHGPGLWRRFRGKSGSGLLGPARAETRAGGMVRSWAECLRRQ